MISNIILISIGGALGAPSRYAINSIFVSYFNFSFPFGTLVVNIIGSFFIGVLVSIIKNSIILDPFVIKYFLIIGFLGSFTTFSAFSLETVEMFIKDNYFFGISYIILTVTLNLIAVYIGINLFNNIHWII